MFGQVRPCSTAPHQLMHNKSKHRADKDKHANTKDHSIGQVKATAFAPALNIGEDSKAASEECSERSEHADDGEECAGHGGGPLFVSLLDNTIVIH